MCPDCKDTGVYVGLNSTEPCKTCGGNKPEPAPAVTYEQVSDKWTTGYTSSPAFRAWERSTADEIWKQLFQSGAMTRNECRKREGWV